MKRKKKSLFDWRCEAMYKKKKIALKYNAITVFYTINLYLGDVK